MTYDFVSGKYVVKTLLRENCKNEA
jgi:hypothetical protein